MAESSTITQPVADLIEASVGAVVLGCHGNYEEVVALRAQARQRYLSILSSPEDKQSLALFMAMMARLVGDSELRYSELLAQALDAAKERA